MALTSAPVACFGPWAALLGTPAVWGILAGLLVSRHAHAWVPIAMLLHDLTGVVLAVGEELSSRVYVGRVWSAMPWALASWAALYGVGQVLTWRLYFTRLLRNKSV